MEKLDGWSVGRLVGWPGYVCAYVSKQQRPWAGLSQIRTRQQWFAVSEQRQGVTRHDSWHSFAQ